MSANIFSPRRERIFEHRQRRLPGFRVGAVRLPRQPFRHVIAAALLVDTAREEKPREKIAEITGGTPQSASNYLNARGGLNGETLVALMMGFPVLRRTVSEIIARFARDPEILDRKLVELEALWRSLGGERA